MAGARGSAANRLRMRLNREEGLKALDQIVLDYAYVEGMPFTFKDHEYQIEIIKDTSQRISVRKCSQVGLSELMVQKTLALAAVMDNIRIIFTLPTKEMAMAFSKDRFDGAIQASDHYSGLMAPGANGASQKKIGESMLYVGGTYGSTGAISIPAEFVISDEVDFSNPTVLGKLNSRIRHARTLDEFGQRGFRYRFSTPTFHGYGVDVDFQKGDQRYYLCKCKHCDTWVSPDYERDMILPGYDGKIIDLRQEHVESGRFNIDQAFIQCSHCKKDLFESLMDPSRRQWVPMISERKLPERSYQVHPWDVPLYNTAPAILRQIGDYPLKSDFMNFVIGLPYSDAENTFMTGDAHKRQVCDVDLWIFKNCVVKAPTVGGMDVGKICHLSVKVKVSGGWHVIWMEKIVNSKASPAAPAVIERYDFFRMRKLCIDAGPDITLVNLLLAAREGIVSVVYVNNIDGPVPIKEKTDGDVINADRTKTLSLLLEAHNAGELHYPHRDDIKTELFEHLETTKKLRKKEADGSMTESFIKTSKVDHWVHSLNYANIAGLACDWLSDQVTYHAAPVVGHVALGSSPQQKPESDKKKEPTHHVLKGLFGMQKPRNPLRR